MTKAVVAIEINDKVTSGIGEFNISTNRRPSVPFSPYAQNSSEPYVHTNSELKSKYRVSDIHTIGKGTESQVGLPDDYLENRVNSSNFSKSPKSALEKDSAY